MRLSSNQNTTSIKVELDSKVSVSGNQSISGVKTFVTEIIIPTAPPPNPSNGSIWIT